MYDFLRHCNFFLCMLYGLFMFFFQLQLGTTIISVWFDSFPHWPSYFNVFLCCTLSTPFCSKSLCALTEVPVHQSSFLILPFVFLTVVWSAHCVTFLHCGFFCVQLFCSAKKKVNYILSAQFRYNILAVGKEKHNWRCIKAQYMHYTMQHWVKCETKNIKMNHFHFVMITVSGWFDCLQHWRPYYYSTGNCNHPLYLFCRYNSHFYVYLCFTMSISWMVPLNSLLFVFFCYTICCTIHYQNV
jgi:hypothetical protein